jgi:hypothetical protein
VQEQFQFAERVVEGLHLDAHRVGLVGVPRCTGRVY